MTTCLLLSFIKLMTVLICHQQMKTGVISVNVALYKAAKDCRGKVLPEITDGDRDLSRSVTMDLGCYKIVIELGGTYDIHYVVLFARKEDNILIEIKLQSLDGTESVCSEFWGTLTSPRGARVNCGPQDAMSSKVVITSRKMHVLPISEIEVHNIATRIADKKWTYFRGCFKNFVGGNELSAIGMKPEICRVRCSNFIYFGIKENSRCSCANDYDDNDEMPPESCDMLCKDGVTSCGGKELTSVYLGIIRLPNYQHCASVVPDDKSKIVSSSSMSVSECIRNCDEYNYAFLGGGMECFCSNIFIEAVDAQRCNKICSFTKEICGGDDAMSVYQIRILSVTACLKQYPVTSIKCSKQFKCAGSYNMYGLCLGGCREGFLGDYCLEKGTIRLPTYKGCVTMKLGLESHMQGTMTVAKCLQHCRDYNHAALRNGNDCFCTNEYLTVAQKYDECTVKCSGNPNEICGGEEYMSLYESLLIKNILRCAGSYDMYGLCVGGCKEGFQGDYCIERVLQKDDKKEDPQVTCDEPNPCTNQPYTECFIDNNIIKCVCIAGYSRKNEFSECEVLQKDGKKEDPQVTCDEPNPCTNQPYTECFIHNNIIKCVCIVGYSRRNAFSECEDFDECAFKPCDAESAVCINTNGSYICECLPGFNRMNLTEVCIANVSVGNEPKVIGFKYWTTLAYLGPLLSVLFLFFIVCFYASPQKTESFDEPPIATKKKKVSNASTTTAN